MGAAENKGIKKVTRASHRTAGSGHADKPNASKTVEADLVGIG